MNYTNNMLQKKLEPCENNDDMSNNGHFIEMTIKHDARLSVLEERFDRHSDRWDSQFDKIIAELKDIKDTYYKERDDFIRRIHLIESELKAEMKVTKVYLTIAGGIAGFVATILASYLKQYL